MAKIKICGIKTVEDALFCANAGADAVGLVFAVSTRRVDLETARKISAALPPFIHRVGVFLDAGQDVVEWVTRYCGLTALQFHGDEDESYCRSFSLPVIKAVKIKTRADISKINSCAAEAILLDTLHPTLAGGSGETFDWTLVEQLPGKALILAGGLHAGNVAEALEVVRPYGVDVSSGVETDGKKDRAKIKAFIDAVRRCA